MKKIASAFVVTLLVLVPVLAIAVPAGKTVVFEKGAVTFDGKKHADAGLKCGDCHTKIFKMKKGDAKVTLAGHADGTGCSTCHNGNKAFSQVDPANCTKCHVIPKTPGPEKKKAKRGTIKVPIGC